MVMEKIVNFILKRIMACDYYRLNYSLVNGLSGMSLFLYEYSSINDDDDIIAKANNMIERIWGNLLNVVKDDSPNFCYGTSGIIWTLEHLEKSGYISLDTSSKEQLFKINDIKFINERFFSPILVDTRSKLFTHGLYFLKRQYCEPFEQYSNLERMIMLIQESERIINRQFFDNISELESFKLLNSILFFLLECKKLKIYPSKIEQLLSILIEQVNLITKSKYDIVDYFTFTCLIKFYLEGNVKTKFNNCYDGRILPLSDTELIDTLTKAAFYSLIYENNEIFRVTYKLLKCNEDKIYNLIRDNVGIGLSIHGLSGIGLGLLSLNSN